MISIAASDSEIKLIIDSLQPHAQQPSSCICLSLHILRNKMTSNQALDLKDNEAILSSEAGTPFDEANADVILRTSDNVDFRVFKIFLSFSSPLFRTMFELPQAEGNIGETKGGLPITLVSEHSTVLKRLLLFCLPLDIEVYDDIKDIQSLLEVAIKYTVNRAVEKAKEWLMLPRFLEAEPLRVFAIACRYGLQEEALTAARLTWNRPLADENIGQELDYTFGTQLFRLLQYQRHCIQAVRSLATDFVWIKETTFCWFNCDACSCTAGLVGPNRVSRRYSCWWDTRMREVARALKNCPWEHVKPDELLKPNIRDTQMKCHFCALNSINDLQVFSRLFQSQIEVAIRKV